MLAPSRSIPLANELRLEDLVQTNQTPASTLQNEPVFVWIKGGIRSGTAANSLAQLADLCLRLVDEGDDITEDPPPPFTL